MNHRQIAFSIAVDGFLLSIQAEGYSPETIKIYKWGLEKLRAPEDLNDLNKKHLQETFSRLYKELSPASIDNVWIALRSFMEWAEGEFEIERVDLSIKRPRYKSPEINPFSHAEIKQLLKGCIYTNVARTKGRRTFYMRRPTADRDHAIILTLLDTGVRVSELSRISNNDIDLKKGEIKIRSHLSGLKSRPRTVYIGTATKKAIWNYTVFKQANSLFETNNGVDPLFKSRDGLPMNKDSIRHFLIRLGKRAKVDDVHAHRFRHTFAIEYLRNGGDVFTLQRILGLASWSMVRRYSAIAEADCKARHEYAGPVDRIV